MYLQITVPRHVHDAVAEACGQDFAGSYLSGAVVSEQGVLLPYTHIAWERLTGNAGAMAALRRVRVTVKEPPYFGQTMRPSLHHQDKAA